MRETGDSRRANEKQRQSIKRLVDGVKIESIRQTLKVVWRKKRPIFPILVWSLWQDFQIFSHQYFTHFQHRI